MGMACKVFAPSWPIAVGYELDRSKSGVVADSISSWKPSTFLRLNLHPGNSRKKGMGSSLQLRGRPSSRLNVYVAHERSSFFTGLTKSQDVLPEKDYSYQPPVIGNSSLEKWLEKYVSEIVTHLSEAPFLQYVFKSNHFGGSNERQTVSEEFFDKPETWGPVKQNILDSAPEGIVLVHRLDEKTHNEYSDLQESQASGSNTHTDIWGVLLYGCSAPCNSVYILKTTQCTSPAGILTHFCLSRAKCFGPSLDSQLESTYLL